MAREYRTPTLGTEIRAVRERKVLSLRECAETSGVSRGALAAVERGRRYPSLKTLEALAECLGVTFVIGPRDTILEE